MKKTKVVCTMGPNTNDKEVMRKLIQNGMDVARFNFSHGDHEEQKFRMDLLKELREEEHAHTAILLDTKGPEIRTGLLKDGKKVTLQEGNTFVLTMEDIVGDDTKVSLSYKGLAEDVQQGTVILIDDGLIGLKVKEIVDQDIVCEIVNGGELGERKGVNVPNVPVRLPAITEKDKEDIKFGVEQDIDFIAASFVRNAECVLEIRAFLKELDAPYIPIIAKIENAEGIRNIDEIIRAADGIMVARGDMGVEIPAEEVPYLQKMLIQKCNNNFKTVITATQMLDSMMKHPRPTRAESTDVANAIYDGTSAIMLSGETAAGMYPIEAVKTMVRIATRTEHDINYLQRFRQRRTMCNPDVTNAISHATCTMAGDLSAAAIVTVTKSGRTARMISKYRPDCTIIGECLTEKVCRQLNLEWGVEPILITEEQDASQLFEKAVDVAETAGFVSKGELVVLTGGVPLGVSGTTNLIKVQVAGHILVTGKGLNGKKISGNLCVCHSNEDLKSFKDGDIIVAADTTNEMMAQMRQASALIVEAEGANCHAAIAGLSLDIPVLIAAKNALDVLKTSAYVEVDCESGVVSAN